MEKSKKIQCQIVCYNDGKTIIECIASILESDIEGYNVDFLIIDNLSTDGSIEKIKSAFSSRVHVADLKSNLGFAGGHNWGIRHAFKNNCDYIAILNPDLLLNRDCIINLVKSLSVSRKIGIAAPKLYRTSKDFQIEKKYIDASGMYFLPSMRHLDRTENYVSSDDVPAAEDLFNSPQYVIGASGACFVISAECVRDISFPRGLLGEEEYLFDPDFFVYREDAELALRSQWMGWKTIYVPTAIGHHKRFVRPDNRKNVPETYNRMSVRNRFLFQGNDISLTIFILTFPSSLIRNLLVILGCFFQERSSIPGLREVFDLRHRTWEKRKWIMQNRKSSNLFFHNWFKDEYAFPPALVNSFEAKLDGVAKSTVTVIVINYFQSEDLNECLESLSKIESEHFLLNVNVVNNSRDDSGIPKLIERYDKVRFVDHGINYGFSGAINFIAKEESSEFLLILNPDIIIDEKAITDCLTYFINNANLAAISPLLVDYQSAQPQIEYSLRRFPRLLLLLFELPGIKKLFPNNPVLKFQHYKDETLVSQGIENRTGIFEVEQLAGACLFIRKKAFDDVRGFDENFFPAWGEDVDFAIKLYKKNYVSALNCNCSVLHKGGTSTSSLAKAEFLRIYYGNYVHLWKKHTRGLKSVVGVSILGITFFIKRVVVGTRDSQDSLFEKFKSSLTDTAKVFKK